MQLNHHHYYGYILFYIQSKAQYLFHLLPKKKNIWIHSKSDVSGCIPSVRVVVIVAVFVFRFLRFWTHSIWFVEQTKTTQFKFSRNCYVLFTKQTLFLFVCLFTTNGNNSTMTTIRDDKQPTMNSNLMKFRKQISQYELDWRGI